MTLPETTVREVVGETLATVVGGTVFRGESLSTSGAVVACKEATVLGGWL